MLHFFGSPCMFSSPTINQSDLCTQRRQGGNAQFPSFSEIKIVFWDKADHLIWDSATPKNRNFKALPSGGEGKTYRHQLLLCSIWLVYSNWFKPIWFNFVLKLFDQEEKTCVYNSNGRRRVLIFSYVAGQYDWIPNSNCFIPHSWCKINWSLSQPQSPSQAQGAPRHLTWYPRHIYWPEMET